MLAVCTFKSPSENRELKQLFTVRLSKVAFRQANKSSAPALGNWAIKTSKIQSKLFQEIELSFCTG